MPAEITGRFVNTLALTDHSLTETQSIRRELLRRVIALEPVIDAAKGESSQIRYHSPVLQQAVDGLFSALAAWRTVASMLAWLPSGEADEAARAVAQEIRRNCDRRNTACRTPGWPILRKSIEPAKSQHAA